MSYDLSEEIFVREALPGDIDEVLDLWVELQRTNTEYDPRLTPTSQARQWMQDFLLSHLKESHCSLFVACKGDAIIGYIFGQILQRPTLVSQRTGYIADICVHSQFRGRGIGRRLYVRATSWFLEQNIVSVEVQVVRNNPASQAFWRKMGFSDFLRTLQRQI